MVSYDRLYLNLAWSTRPWRCTRSHYVFLEDRVAAVDQVCGSFIDESFSLRLVSANIRIRVLDERLAVFFLTILLLLVLEGAALACSSGCDRKLLLATSELLLGCVLAGCIGPWDILP